MTSICNITKTLFSLNSCEKEVYFKTILNYGHFSSHTVLGYCNYNVVGGESSTSTLVH